MSQHYRIFVSANGNMFMAEIAGLIAAAATDLGRWSTVVHGGLPGEAGDGAVEFVVAPHEYFPLLRDRVEREKLASVDSCVLIATEQPGTSWFETSFAYCRNARLVLDINKAGVAELRARSVNVHHLPLGYHSSLDEWRGESGRPRPVDLLFMGALTPRREMFLGEHAAAFAPFASRILLTDPTRPLIEPAANFVTGREKHLLLAGSKVLLNLHQGEQPYFEWHRIVPALANGCVVVSEPSRDYGPLRAFEHFVEAPLDTLPAYVVSLLADEERRERLAAEAYAFVRAELSMAQSVALLPQLLGAGPAHGRRRSRVPAARATLRVAVEAPRRGVATGKQRARSWARQRAEAAVERSPFPRLHASSVAMQGALKTILLNQAALRRRLEALEVELATGEREPFELVTSASFDSLRTPQVTVGIPLYNYEHHVETCLDSVLATRGILAETIVVDDHSTDRSAQRVREYIGRHSHHPIALVAKRVNGGLSEARNTVFAHARSEFIFLLDADNLVYPDGLRKLLDALARSEAAFAYGILERFGEQPELHGRTPGLVSALPWDVERLVYGNYIDAMALVRRSAWEAVGGFNRELDERFGGWEDYAFWLALAEQGLEGILVPEIVGRYRSHRGSMLSTVNLDLESIFRFLRARYATLPWPAA